MLWMDYDINELYLTITEMFRKLMVICTNTIPRYNNSPYVTDKIAAAAIQFAQWSKKDPIPAYSSIDTALALGARGCEFESRQFHCSREN